MVEKSVKNPVPLTNLNETILTTVLASCKITFCEFPEVLLGMSTWKFPAETFITGTLRGTSPRTKQYGLVKDSKLIFSLILA